MPSPMVLIHVCAATVGLIAGALSMTFRKGSDLHRLAGNAFVIAMLIMASSASFMAVFLRPNAGNALGGLLMIYLVTTAWVTAKRREARVGRFDYAALLVAVVVVVGYATFGIQAANSGTGLKDGYPSTLYFVFGTITSLFAVSDVRMILRGGVAGTKRIARHLWRMCLAFIMAAASFYPGQAKLFPRDIRRTNLLYEPLILLIGATIFWMVRVSSTKPRRPIHRAVVPVAIAAALAAASLFAQTPLIEQGRTAILRGDTDAAIDIMEKAVAQSPTAAEAHYYLAAAYESKVQKSGMLAAARYASKIKEEFEKAVSLNPNYVDARFGLVEFYAAAPGFMGGSYDTAFEQAKQIKAIDPVVGHRAYAFIYLQEGKPELAKKEYVDAVREQPNSPKAHSYYGQFLANTEKNYPAAFVEFETVLKVDPAYMAGFYHLGRTASLSNTNFARGEEALKRYVAYTPKENEPSLASAHYYLGTLFEKQGRRAEAKRSYETALKLNPTLKQAAEALKRVS
jgi:tetratricopeptide (TPR) repeat protein/uncharacterized membrane protein